MTFLCIFVFNIQDTEEKILLLKIIIIFRSIGDFVFLYVEFW